MNKKNYRDFLQSHSPAMQQCLRSAQIIACSDVNVLIFGESGAGKDALAAYIHQQGKRAKQVLLSVNCAVLPKHQAQSLLFDKYIYDDRNQIQDKGLFARAVGSTLYLQNIDRLPMQAQEKLLQYLKQAEVDLSATTQNTRQSVRLIAASCQNLEQACAQKCFHQELFYYLNTVPLQLPALRQRKEDITALVQSMLVDLVKLHHCAAPVFDTRAMQAIKRYDWPGNLPQLYNFCQRMILFFPGKTIGLENLPAEIQKAYVYRQKSGYLFKLPEQGIKLDEVEQDLFQQAILQSKGNKSKAARLLGLSRDAFLYRLKKYKLLV